MSEAFDPYHRWLGIPPEDQPPNYYRLLGLKLFESDADVIDSAVNRQMAHLRTFQVGPHAALSQNLLNEVATARVCLLNPTKKAAYDDSMRSAAQIVTADRLPPKTAVAPPPTRAVNLDKSPVHEVEAQGEDSFDIAELVQQSSRLPRRSVRQAGGDKHGSDQRKKPKVSPAAISALVAGSLIFGAIIVFLIALIVTKPPRPRVATKTEPSQSLPSAKAAPSGHPAPAKVPSGRSVADNRIAGESPSALGDARTADDSETTTRVPDGSLPEKSKSVIDAPPSPKSQITPSVERFPAATVVEGGSNRRIFTGSAWSPHVCGPSINGRGRIEVSDGRVIEMNQPNLTPPSDFDADFYLKEYPDVAAHPYFSLHPYEHYFYCGKTEHRKTHADTSRAVASSAPENDAPNRKPVLHESAPVVLEYDWRQGQLEDWKWTGEAKPFVNQGVLEFHSGGQLLLRRADIRITDVLITVQTLDRTQAMDIVVGENKYRLHFLDSWIQAGSGTSVTTRVRLDHGWQSVSISIPSGGDSFITAGSSQATAPVKAPGALQIGLDQPRPFLIRQIVVKGVKTEKEKSDPIVGKWVRVDYDYDKFVKEFLEDGTFKHNGTLAGKWKCLDKATRKYEAAWSSRSAIDWVVVSADGATISGTTETGATWRAQQLQERLPLSPEAKHGELSLSAITDLVFLVGQAPNRRNGRRSPVQLVAPTFFNVTKDGAPPEHGFFNVDGKAAAVVWKSSAPRVIRVDQQGEQVSFHFLSAGKVTVSVTAGKLSARKNVEVCQLPFTLGISAADFIAAHGLANEKTSELPNGSWGAGATHGEVWEYKKWPRCLITVNNSQIVGVFTKP